MKKYKVYLFDFDGTIIDTREALAYVYMQSFKDWGVDVTREETIQFSREPLNVSYVNKGCDMAVFWDFVDLINEYLNGEYSVSLAEKFDDTDETFKKLKEMKKDGVISGIVTSNNVPHVKDILNCLKIDYDFMDVFVGNQECLTPKPDPKPINTALEMLKYDGDLSEVVYVGDALNDALAAANAGVDSYLLDRENVYHDTPYKIIHSLLELFE